MKMTTSLSSIKTSIEKPVEEIKEKQVIDLIKIKGMEDPEALNILRKWQDQ